MNAEMNDHLNDPGAPRPIPKRFAPTVIPPARPAAQLLIAHDPFAERCEKIRALRTELLLRRENTGEADMIVVLSPCVGDGRSQLSAELAIAFAQLNRPTLLVDADLRNPMQHALFEASNQAGLAQAIERGNPCFHTVDGVRHLSLLTAGPTPDNPLELLLDRGFEAMTEEWRRTYDFVVIDTPPVAQFSDGLAVANLTKRVLAVSRAKHTRYKDSRDMLHRLTATRAQIVGGVLNHF